MHILNGKSSSEKRQRPDYNGAVTALTEAEWIELAAHRRGAYVLLVGERIEQRDKWLVIMGRFASEDKTGARVQVMSHNDYVDHQRRVAEAALVAL